MSTTSITPDKTRQRAMKVIVNHLMQSVFNHERRAITPFGMLRKQVFLFLDEYPEGYRTIVERLLTSPHQVARDVGKFFDARRNPEVRKQQDADIAYEWQRDAINSCSSRIYDLLKSGEVKSLECRESMKLILRMVRITRGIEPEARRNEVLGHIYAWLEKTKATTQP